MSNPPNTPEQAKIYAEVPGSKRNIVIQARAGTGKTTILKGLAPLLSGKILAITFNKANAEELKEKMPGVKAGTMHSLAYGVTARLLGVRRLTVPKSKDYHILSTLIKERPKEQQEDLWDVFSDLLAIFADMKIHGYVPPSLPVKLQNLTRPDTSFEDVCYLSETPVIREVLNDAMFAALNAAVEEATVDFNEMIYLSALSPSAQMPDYDVIMVDEAQDLSDLDVRILSKLKQPWNRIIAVGDSAQAIYGFRGGLDNALDLITEKFNCVTYPLNVCFRCDQAIVTNARWRVPEFQWRDDAGVGEVHSPGPWSLFDLKSGDALICETNAPLFRAALVAFHTGHPIRLARNDIMATIEKHFTKMRKMETEGSTARDIFNAYREMNSKKYKSRKTWQDIMDCISIFMDEPTVTDAFNKFCQLRENTRGVTALTGHKAKGAEYNQVFYLMPEYERGGNQALNLKYVIETRARHVLRYVRWGDCAESLDEPAGDLA